MHPTIFRQLGPLVSDASSAGVLAAIMRMASKAAASAKAPSSVSNEKSAPHLRVLWPHRQPSLRLLPVGPSDNMAVSADSVFNRMAASSFSAIATSRYRVPNGQTACLTAESPLNIKQNCCNYVSITQGTGAKSVLIASIFCFRVNFSVTIQDLSKKLITSCLV